MDHLPHPRSHPEHAQAREAQGLTTSASSDAYDRSHPAYPTEAARWLVGTHPMTVVELGAGTGKFTDELLALGHDVLATDPSDTMLQHLRLRHPDLRVATAPAEQIPAATRSVDVVVAAQSFHRFDLDRALPEIARVLKPEGRIGLVWNDFDTRIPWVRRLARLLDDGTGHEDPTDALVASTLFGYVEVTSFRFWQPMRRHELHDLAISRSDIAAMDPMAQDRVLRKVDELFSEYDRGPDGLLLPYVTHCYQAVVRPRGIIDEPEHSADLTAAAEAVRAAMRAQAESSAAEAERAATLIDFH